MEPSDSTLNLSSILLRYIAECGLRGLTGKRICLGPQAMFACPLDNSIRIQQNGAWTGIGGISIEILVSVPHTY